jgi:hypothetical protein
MSALLTDLDAWLTAAVLAALMLAGWSIGWWHGQRLAQEEHPAAHKFDDAVLALLGLLLAFTFSMSLGKHDQRRLMVVTDSNAIGDFYTCASLVKEPVRGKLQGVIRGYVEHRLAVVRDRLDEGQQEQELRRVQEMHDRMQALVGEAVDGGTPVVVPLVNTFNGVTSSHAARLAAGRDRLPESIVGLLFLAAVVAVLLVGRQQGAAREREWVATIGFVILVSMAVWVTLDLNQPQRGLITVSQEPLQRLLSGMGK